MNKYEPLLKEAKRLIEMLESGEANHIDNFLTQCVAIKNAIEIAEYDPAEEISNDTADYLREQLNP